MKRWAVMPLGALHWPHLQRLTARWWRRWVYALTGCSLGVALVWLAQPEVREDHAQAEQAVATLSQQLAAVPVAAATPPAQAMPSGVQGRLASLPAVTQQGQIWTDWQQFLAAHGLRLQSLRPLASESVVSSASASGGVAQHASLPHQAAALRVQGRFEDWTRAWAACAETGPVCSLDRISVAALPQTAEVQIDVVLRIWMRPGEEGAGAQALPTAWIVPSSASPLSRSAPALFAAETAVSGALAGAAARAQGVRSEDERQATGAAATGTGLASAAAEDLPPDPRHWPLARVRWVGLWQQGSDRHAILSAGPHGAKVRLGQRVTQEGHRVVAIAEDGVSLRLAQEPVIQLDGMRPAAEGHSMGSGKP